jgi:hypothetical protein
MFSRLLNEIRAYTEERKANQAKGEANIKAHMLEVMERQIGSLAANMKAGQEKMDANQARMEEITAKIEDSLKEKMRLTVSAIEDMMEAAVNSIRSALDEKIQSRIENVMKCVDHKKQEIAEKIEKTQAELRTVEASLDIRARKLEENLENMRTGFITSLTMVNLGARPINRETLAQQCSMEETIETNNREFQAQVEEVKAIAERGRGIRSGASAAQPPTFDGTASWAVFRRQFETAAEHNCWTHQEKSTYLITALQDRAANVLHGIPTSATYEETLQASEDRFGDQHFAAAYRSQLKTRPQRVGGSLREFATAIEQLARSAYPTLPDEQKKREAGRAFAAGVEDPDIKIQLLLVEKTVNEAFRQALGLQAVFLAARPQKNSAKPFWGNRSPTTREWNARQSGCWSCGAPGHFGSICPYRKNSKNDRRWKHDDKPSGNTRKVRYERRPRDNRETRRNGGQRSGNE